MMNEKPRQILCDLLRSHGVSLSQDRTRCSGLLRDHCGTFKAETTVLLAAMEEGIPASLTGQSGNFAPAIIIGQLVKKMQTDRQLTEEAARWAVESWALALGISVLQPNVVPKYAGFRLRVYACILDLILSGLVILVVEAIIWFTIAAVGGGGDNIKEIEGFVGYVILLFIYWFWYTKTESSTWQATLGKKLLHLKVTDEQGNRISFGLANKRYWSKILSTLILLVGFLMVAFTEKKQGLHDKIAGTLVVKAV